MQRSLCQLTYCCISESGKSEEMIDGHLKVQAAYDRGVYYCMQAVFIMLLSVTLLVIQYSHATSKQLIVSGYSFSDELGGFRLVSVTGEGTRDKPFVIEEEVFGVAPAILTIRRMKHPTKLNRWLYFNRYMTIHIEKNVVNLSRKVWRGYELELRQKLSQPSSYEDGLSFDQITRLQETLSADRFAKLNRMFEPRDKIRFEQGYVNPGQRLKLAAPISDTTPDEVFYLIQKPWFLLAGLR